MKSIFNRFVFVLIIAGTIIGFSGVWAQTEDSLRSATEEKINNYGVTITVATDSTISVVEDIDYDFGVESKHGIFRFIPVVYKGRHGERFALRLKFTSVTDESGKKYPYTISYADGKASVKIGDKNILISGQHHYRIAYTVGRALGYFADHDELYWNAIGTEWPVPIGRVAVRLRLPAEVSSSGEPACYVGEYGSTTTACAIEKTPEGITFKNLAPLAAGEGFTVVAGWPKGVVNIPSRLRTMVDFFIDNPWLLLPPLLAIFFMTRWFVIAREPRGRGVIIAEYEPPQGLLPGEVGALVDKDADNEDAVATLIDLAVRGFLKIKDTGKDAEHSEYEFIRLKDGSTLTTAYERTLFTELFRLGEVVKLASLKEKFYTTMNTVREQIEAGLSEKGYYSKNPRMTGVWFNAGGVVLMVVGIFWFCFRASSASWINFVGIELSGLTIFCFYWTFAPLYSTAGILAKEAALGFKLFLSVTEAERLKFFNSPTVKPEMFEKFLPYAIAFRVEKEWAAQFKDLAISTPNWYESNRLSAFTAVTFTSSLHSFSEQATATLNSAPSSRSGSSGGGSSGGGGGGGGSW